MNASIPTKGAAIQSIARDEYLQRVIAWLERMADNVESRARGDLGQMFTNTRIDAWREAARILREHPEVLENP